MRPPGTLGALSICNYCCPATPTNRTATNNYHIIKCYEQRFQILSHNPSLTTSSHVRYSIALCLSFFFYKMRITGGLIS